MNIWTYVAGSSDAREHTRVRAAMDAVSEIPGVQLAIDWLKPIQAGKPANGLSLEESAGYARADLEAIDASDVFWFLAPEHPTRGAWCELGYALRRGMPVIVSGNVAQSIFLALATNVGSDAAALDWLRCFAAERLKAS